MNPHPRIYASARRRCPPIVALTANTFPEDRHRCLNGGMDDYLSKPFERTELEALLAKWCARADELPRARTFSGYAA